MNEKKFFSPFYAAIRGLIIATKEERNMKIHIVLGIIALLFFGYLLKTTYIEMCIIILAIGLVISMELMNSAQERIMNNPKDAKDIAAGAVLFSCFIAIIIGVILVAKAFFHD